jgi:cysteine-rich repeat protein
MKKIFCIIFLILISFQFVSADNEFKKDSLVAYWSIWSSLSNPIDQNNLQNQGNYLTAQNSDGLSPDQSMAICFWFKATSESNNQRLIISKYGSYEFKTQQIGWPPNFNFKIIQENGISVQTSSQNFGKNIWSHTCGIAHNGKIYLYMQGTERYNSNYDNTIKTSSYDFYVKAEPPGLNIFNGNIQGLAIWKNIQFVDDNERRSFVQNVYDKGYRITYQDLIAGCGDNILLSPEECDDSNTNNNDGCNSQCIIEPDWACDTTYQPSTCILISDLVQSWLDNGYTIIEIMNFLKN